MSLAISYRGHVQADSTGASRPSASSGNNKSSRRRPTTLAYEQDDQLTSPFFAKLPPEIRSAILTIFIYDGSPTQHIAHFHGSGAKPSDSFVRSRCIQQPDSPHHIAELMNLRRSPWRDGHWKCWEKSRRQSEERRRKHRDIDGAAAAAGALAVSVDKSKPRSRQSVPLTSQTWSFSLPLLSASDKASDNEESSDCVLQVSKTCEINTEAQKDIPTAKDTENGLSSPLPLLLSCQRMHNEVADVLYTSLFFVGLKSMRYFFRKVTSRSYLDRIQHVTLQWDAIIRQMNESLAGYDLRDWDPACQGLSQLTELSTFDVKIFVCERTSSWTRDFILRSVDPVRANAKVSASIVKDCKDSHACKNSVALVTLGDLEIPINICMEALIAPDG